jgi:uncharacterized protein YkwD
MRLSKLGSRRYYGEPRHNWSGCWYTLLTSGVLAFLLLGVYQLGNTWPWLIHRIDFASISPQTPAANERSPVAAPPVQPVLDFTGQICPAECADLGVLMLHLVNRDRTANGLSALDWYQPAAIAAQRHAEDMLQRDYFAHTSPEGGDVGQRLQAARAGAGRAWSENIWRFTSGTVNGIPVSVADWPDLVAKAQIDWMNSPGHRANILNSVYTHLGVGIAYDPVKGEVRITQVFFTLSAP